VTYFSLYSSLWYLLVCYSLVTLILRHFGRPDQTLETCNLPLCCCRSTPPGITRPILVPTYPSSWVQSKKSGCSRASLAERYALEQSTDPTTHNGLHLLGKRTFIDSNHHITDKREGTFRAYLGRPYRTAVPKISYVALLRHGMYLTKSTLP
jgi:hypothetical protein